MQNFYTLRQVANLTGLTEFTLRGWEGRYNAFAPNRSDTGRRQYTKIDLKRAFLLRELTHLGCRIGDVASLTTAALEKKLDLQNELKLKPVEKRVSKPVEKIEAIMKLVLMQDWDQLKKAIHDQLSKKTVVAAIQNVILPLLASLSNYVASERIGIAQEHILSALIKEQLYILLSRVSNKQKKYKNVAVVIAAPEGDFHDLGILLAHVLLNSIGVNSLYLGPNSPKNELCETVIRFGATHVFLASTMSRREGAKDDIFSYLHYVDQHLPPTIDMWVGGRNFEKLKFDLKRNLTFFKTLQELTESIQNNLKSK